jgi:hypothetical protein
LEATVRRNPVSSLAATTLAAGIEAPVGSVILPLTVDVVVCADNEALKVRATIAAERADCRFITEARLQSD